MKRIIIILSVFLCNGLAYAGEGPCGIELGTWARTLKVCKSLKRGDLGNDQDAWMIFKPGARWEQWETSCKIHDAKLKDGVCNYKIACQGEEGKFDEKETVRIGDNKNIVFIYGKAELSYIHCGPPIKTPYSED